MGVYLRCERTYGSVENGHVKRIIGNRHEYLAMTLDFNKNGRVIIDMREYIKTMIKKFPYKLDEKISCL